MLRSAAQKTQLLYEEAKESHQFDLEWWIRHLDQARESIADLIRASPNEIAFVSSTSSGLSLIASSIRWKEGDRVLYPADEYPSNRFVWDHLREKGVHTEALEPIQDLPFSKQLETLNLKQVRLVAVSAVSFWDGRRHDIEQIAHICQAHGILLSVDAVQAVGALRFKKEEQGDFLTT